MWIMCNDDRVLIAGVGKYTSTALGDAKGVLISGLRGMSSFNHKCIYPVTHWHMVQMGVN